MASARFDRETLREIFVYLYRCWIEMYIGEVPSKLALSPDDGILVSRKFALYFSLDSVDEALVSDLKDRVKKPLLIMAPEFPAGTLGISDLSKAGHVGQPFDQVLSVVRKKLGWFDTHRERGLTNKEAYETQEDGRFAVWKSRNVSRLLFQPIGGQLYGYAVVRNSAKDFFFHKSRSCKQEGKKTADGRYKRCQHRIEERDTLNIDLLYETGEVMLLRLTLAGAGYKVFPRETPEPEPQFP